MSQRRRVVHRSPTRRHFVVLVVAGRDAVRADARLRDACLVQVAIDRPGEHGRPNHRRRRRSEESEDVLRHRRDGRDLEDDQRRHDVHSALGERCRSRRWATSRSRRAIRRSSTPAPVRTTRATASRRAGASTSRPTAGVTWQSVGLEKTQHIGRIVVHPTNPEHRRTSPRSARRGRRIRSADSTRPSTAGRRGS